MALQHLRDVAPAGRQQSDLPALYAVGQSWCARHGYEVGEETAVSVGMVAGLSGRAAHLHATVRDHDRPAALRWAHRYARDDGYQLDDEQADELGRLRAESPGDEKRLRGYLKQVGRRLGSEPESSPEPELLPVLASASAPQEPLSEKLDLRLTPTEKAALQDAAAKLGKTAGWFLRRALRTDLEDAQAERDDFPRRS